MASTFKLKNYVLVCLAVGISACGDEEYMFSEKDLDFVSYKEGQNISFKDTNDIVRNLEQTEYERGVWEDVGWFGTDFIDHYHVSYQDRESGERALSVQLLAKDWKGQNKLQISFREYSVEVNSDSISASPGTIHINGRDYSNVYILKAHKYIKQTGGRENGTIYYNKEYGVIQLLLPNGKSIVKVH